MSFKLLLAQQAPVRDTGSGMWVDNYHMIMIVIIIAKTSKSCQHELIMIVRGPRVRI